MINAIGDLFDIMPAVQENQRPKFKSMNYKEVRIYVYRECVYVYIYIYICGAYITYIH